MKLRIRSYVLYGIFLGGILGNSLFAENKDINSLNPSLNIQDTKEVLQIINSKVIDSYSETLTIVNYLFGQLNSGKWRLKNQSEVRLWLEKVKNSLLEVQISFKKSALSAESLNFFIGCIKHIENVLWQAMESNFADLQEINFDLLVMHRSSQLVSIERLMKETDQIQEGLKNLLKKADFVSYNKIQKIYNSAVDFDEHYHITKYTKRVLLTAALTSALIYFTPLEKLEKIPGGKVVNRVLTPLQNIIEKYIVDFFILGSKKITPQMMSAFEEDLIEKISSNEMLGKEIIALAYKDEVPSEMIKILEVELLPQIVANKEQCAVIVRSALQKINQERAGGLFGLFSSMSRSQAMIGFSALAGIFNTIVTFRSHWETVKKLWPFPQIGEAVVKKAQEVKAEITGTRSTTGGLGQNIAGEIVADLRLEDELFAKLYEQNKPLYVALDFYKDVRKYINAGIKTPRAFLLTGPSGCGKSYIAKAVAGSIQQYYIETGIKKEITFLSITPEVVRGVGFDRIFEWAKQNAPCVLFFDEFHLFDFRSNSAELTKVLTGLDEIDLNQDPNRQIIVIAATNRPELLDLALKRPGRFTIVNCTLPNFEQRKHLLEVKARRSLVIEDINFELFAQLTAGCSFAEISKMFDTAERLARKTGITHHYLYEALNEVIRRIRPDFTLTENEAYRVAIHQAAVALSYLLLNPEHIHLDSVTIKSYSEIIQETYDFATLGKEREAALKKVHKPKYGTVFTWRDDETLVKNDIITQQKLCKIQLAGLVAQRLILGAEAYKPKDKQRAFNKAEQIILNGLTMHTLSPKQQEDIKDQAWQVLKTYEKEVSDLILQNKDKIIQIAQSLQDKKLLTTSEIKMFL